MKRTSVSVTALLLAGQLVGGCASTTGTTTAPTTAISSAPATAVSQSNPTPQPAAAPLAPAAPAAPPFKVVAEQFADLRVLRYQVPGFETLEAQQKELL